MGTISARLSLACVGLIVVSLMFGSISNAKVDLETCDGMWLFDDGGGDVAVDYSEKGNDGTLKNGPEWVEGKIGSALEFDIEKKQSVVTPASTMMDPYPYTFAAWVKVGKYNPDANTGSVVMGNYSGDSKGTIFYISNAGKLCARPHPGTDLKGKTTIPIGEWTHIAATLEGSNLKLYVNGEEDKIGTSAGYAGGLSKIFVIGRASWYEGSYFTGVIDEAGLFSRALSPAEIRDVKISGLQGNAAVSSTGKLIATWAAIRGD